jgi:uncharacterized protein (TIGR03083 family)
MNQQQTADAMQQEREALMAYLWEIPEAAWDKPSLCPGWTVRDVVAHLIGNVADVNAFNLDGAGTEEFNQRQIDERADRSIAELLAEWQEQGAQYEAGIRSFADDFWTSEFPPFGTVSTAARRLVEDIYVHAQDIKMALGEEQSDGAGLIPTLEVVAHELPERAARLAPDVGTVTFDVDGFKDAVKLGGATDVTVSGDAKALAFVGTGRTSLDDAISQGKVTVTPSAPSGLGDALNVYGP